MSAGAAGGTRKARFLASIPQASIEAEGDTLASRCKFNFSYFTVQEAGQDFSQWGEGQLAKLLGKLKDYSAEPLAHWMRQPVGKSGTVLAVYGAFPRRSAFTHPKHVPHQAQWGRFRLEHAVRLVGFVLPKDCHGQRHPSGESFDCNTFYVVFLDAEHAFYQGGEAK